MTCRIFTALLLATLSATASAASSNMQPGLWEITSEVDMPGMPMRLPPQTLLHCYTPEDLAQAQNTVPQSSGGNCRVTDYKVEGNTATWSMECSGETAMHGTGTMITHPTSYTGSMKSIMEGPGGTMEVTSHWRAQRIGDCK